jgi:hypothetical protein
VEAMGWRLFESSWMSLQMNILLLSKADLNYLISWWSRYTKFTLENFKFPESSDTEISCALSSILLYFL